MSEGETWPPPVPVPEPEAVDAQQPGAAEAGFDPGAPGAEASEPHEPVGGLSGPPPEPVDVVAGYGSPSEAVTQPFGYPPPAPWPTYPDANPTLPMPQPPSHVQAPPPKRRGLAGTLVVALLAGLLGGVAAYSLLDAQQTNSGRIEPLPQAEFDDSEPAEGSIADVVDRVLPVVVTLRVTSGNVGASGSGFMIDTDGHLLTNNHVIAAAGEGDATISVILSDGSSVPGTLIGRNASYDLAVVKIDRAGMPAAALGNSDNVRVGDRAIAIGAPLELSETVTEGIISALDRPVTAGGVGEASFINAIQTDAAINPGNSGGPLLNGRGEVVGVNSAIATLAGFGQDSGSIGLGFSIPINQAKRIAEEIIATGTSQTPIIGVSLDVRFTGEGARIQAVSPGGPAEKAGLRAGDVIVKVDDESVSNATEFIVEIRAHAPGEVVELTLADGRTVKVTLEGREES